MCRVNKHISYYRFRNAKCRLCIYLHRYRYGHTKDRFKEYVKRVNTKVKLGCFLFRLSMNWLHQFLQVGFACLPHGLFSYTEKH